MLSTATFSGKHGWISCGVMVIMKHKSLEISVWGSQLKIHKWETHFPDSLTVITSHIPYTGGNFGAGKFGEFGEGSWIG